MHVAAAHFQPELPLHSNSGRFQHLERRPGAVPTEQGRDVCGQRHNRQEGVTGRVGAEGPLHDRRCTPHAQKRPPRGEHTRDRLQTHCTDAGSSKATQFLVATPRGLHRNRGAHLAVLGPACQHPPHSSCDGSGGGALDGRVAAVRHTAPSRLRPHGHPLRGAEVRQAHMAAPCSGNANSSRALGRKSGAGLKATHGGLHRDGGLHRTAKLAAAPEPAENALNDRHSALRRVLLHSGQCGSHFTGKHAAPQGLHPHSCATERHEAAPTQPALHRGGDDSRGVGGHAVGLPHGHSAGQRLQAHDAAHGGCSGGAGQVSAHDTLQQDDTGHIGAVGFQGCHRRPAQCPCRAVRPPLALDDDGGALFFAGVQQPRRQVRHKDGHGLFLGHVFAVDVVDEERDATQGRGAALHQPKVGPFALDARFTGFPDFGGGGGDARRSSLGHQLRGGAVHVRAGQQLRVVVVHQKAQGPAVGKGPRKVRHGHGVAGAHHLAPPQQQRHGCRVGVGDGVREGGARCGVQVQQHLGGFWRMPHSACDFLPQAPRVHQLRHAAVAQHRPQQRQGLVGVTPGNVLGGDGGGGRGAADAAHGLGAGAGLQRHA